MHIACAHCGATNRVPDERLADDPVCLMLGSEGAGLSRLMRHVPV